MTLIELIIATAFGAMAVVAMVELVSAMMRHQSTMQSDIGVLTGAMAASRLAERELRQTTYLLRPASGGAPSTDLEGCVNAAPSPESVVPVALDSSQPVRGYALCARSGALYYHTSAACPPAYTCGVNGTLVAGSEGRRSLASASFTRPSAASTLIEGSISVVSGTSTMTTRASALAAMSLEVGP